MSKTTGMTGLQAGIQSGARAGSEGFASRLEQFRKYAPVQAIDFNQITESQKKVKKSEKFREAAIGMTVTPSNTNMYEAQYQLAKDKANLLFSDEVLEHYAKDQRGMMEWSSKVDQLNQEIAGYEAYYEDSFGDPSKADGTGNTWADHTVRADHPGGEEGFWSDQGVKADRTSALNDTMKIIDSRQHTNMKFNFETGEFDYERLVEQDGAPTGMDPFVVNPQTANELFSYNLTQTVFEGPSDYAEKDVLKRMVDSKEQFDARMDQQLSKDSFRRAVADNYIKEHPNEKMSIDEVMQDAVVFEDAYNDFKKETYDFARQNKANEKSTSKTKGSRKIKPSFSNLIAAGDDTTYQGTFFTQAPVTLTYATEDGTMKSGKFNNIVVDNGELALEHKDGPIPLTQGSIAAQQLDEVMGAGTFARMQYQMQTASLSGGGGSGGATGGVETYQDADLTYNNLVDESRYKPSKSSQHSTQSEELERLSEIVAMTESDAAEALKEMYGDEFDIEEIKPGRDYLNVGGQEISVDETDMKGQSHYENVMKLFNTINK